MMKQKNIFMDRLVPIHFKTTIPIIYVTNTFFENYISLINSKNENDLHNLLNSNLLYEKIHSIQKSKDTNYIIKVIYIFNETIYEYFFAFHKFTDKEKLKEYVIQTFLNNKYIIKINEETIVKINKSYCMSIVYSYKYKKQTNGEKELVPIKSNLFNKLKPKVILKLCDYYCKEMEYDVYIKYYLTYKNKKSKYDKLLKAVFKLYKKNNYLNMLSNDLKMTVINFI